MGFNSFGSDFFPFEHPLASVSCLCFSVQKVDPSSFRAYHAVETILSVAASNDKIAQLQPRCVDWTTTRRRRDVVEEVQNATEGARDGRRMWCELVHDQ